MHWFSPASNSNFLTDLPPTVSSPAYLHPSSFCLLPVPRPVWCFFITSGLHSKALISVSVSYHCVTNHPKSILKQHQLLFTDHHEIGVKAQQKPLGSVLQWELEKLDWAKMALFSCFVPHLSWWSSQGLSRTVCLSIQSFQSYSSHTVLSDGWLLRKQTKRLPSLLSLRHLWKPWGVILSHSVLKLASLYSEGERIESTSLWEGW